jgi:SAM-dependent methyltransferase
MSKTTQYYDENADVFFDSTINIDMSSLYDRFTRHLFPGATILDVGCGSGRDSKFFLDQGYVVTAIDISQKLCSKASQLIGQEVVCRSFKDITEINEYDAIWCCASLLHISGNELSAVFSRLHQALKLSGLMYVSFKYGDFEGERNGRYFTDMTEERLQTYLDEIGFDLVEGWQTSDLRPGREEERWLNAILRRTS